MSVKIVRSIIGASKELHRILGVIGQSAEPLSPREIEIKLYGKHDRHSNVYRIVHDLAGINSKDESIFLVSWNELCSKKKEEYFKNRLVKKISQLFDDPKLKDNESYSFTVYKDESNYGLDVASSKSMPKHMSMENNIIRISFDTGDIKNISGTLQTDYAILAYPLQIKYDKNNNDYKLYVKQSTIVGQRNKIQFLKHVLKNSTKEEISKLGGKDNVFYVDKPNQDISDVAIIEDVSGEGKDEWNRSNMIWEIENNHRNFRYYLGLRGFLLYLTRIQLQPQTNKDKENRGETSLGMGAKPLSYSQTIKRINKIIEAMMINIYTKDDFPFLCDYQVFDAICGSKFKVAVLIEIAIELQNQLYTQSDDFLKYWVTRRFHEEMIYTSSRGLPYPIYHRFRVILWKDRVKDKLDKNNSLDRIIQKLKRYDRNMLELMRNYQKSELDFTNRLLDQSAPII